MIAFVGVLDRAHPFKGVDYLLRAFSRLDDPAAVLLIIGDGDLKPSFVQLASDLGLAGRIFFAGAVAHEELPPYYAAADIVVLPSFPPESFGMVLIEAMACGRPVIAHNIPGVRTIVADGYDGYLVHPGNADNLQHRLEQILTLPAETRQVMGSAGRRKVEQKYSWKMIAKKLENIYINALQDPQVLATKII